jgi:chorismate mutase/prephenate dehydratase
MMNDLRHELDEIDTAVAELLQQRLAIVRHIGRIKSAEHIAVRDRAREKYIIDRLSKEKDKDFALLIAKIYKEIFKTSRRQQKQIIKERLNARSSIK